MWNNLKNNINSYFFRFTYSRKVSFIIFFAVAVAFIMAFMLERSQDKLLNSIEKQQIGLVHIAQTNNLLKSVITYQMMTYQQLESEQGLNKSRTNVDLAFNRLIELSRNSNTALNEKKTDESRKFNSLITSFRQRWEDIKNWETEPKNSEENREDFDKLFQLLKQIVAFINSSSQLNMNIDSATHRIINTVTHNLLLTSIMIPELFLLSDVHLERKATASQQVTVMIIKNLLQANQEAIEVNFHESAKANEVFNDLFQASDAQTYLEEYSNSMKYFLKVIDRKLLKHQGKPISKSAFYKSGMSVLTDIFELEAHTLKILKEVLDRQVKTLRYREMMSTTGVILGTLIILLFYQSRVIRRPLEDFNRAAKALTSGDLNARVPIHSNDEVALMSKEFNDMADFFQSMVFDIKDIAKHLVNSAEKVTTTFKQVEGNVHNQEIAIRRIANHAKGISQTVHNFSNTLSEVNTSVSKTSELALLGRKSLNEMEEVIKSMEEGAITIVSALANLQDNMSSVNIIINRVIKVVDQANLLSINSAITANRSGEKGAGFTVVSDKIRELADQTAYFTLDIEEKVRDIGPTVIKAVNSVEGFTKSIREQAVATKQINQELGVLIDNTQSQINTFETVNESMQNQLKGSSQIDNSIAMLSKVAQNTTKSIGHLYAEIDFLNEATASLQTMISQFTSRQSETEIPSDKLGTGTGPADEALLKRIRKITLSNVNKGASEKV